MTKETLRTFGPSDVNVTIRLDDNTEYTIQVRRFVCETYSDGSAYGIFELGSEFDDHQGNIFERIMREQSEMDIIVNPKYLNYSLTDKPLHILQCERCVIDSIRLNIPVSGDIVTSQCFFSNFMIDWDKSKLELPKVTRVFNPDPLFRIARGIEDIKKIMPDVQNIYNGKDKELVFTIEEFTDLILNGRLPDGRIIKPNEII